MNIYEKFTAKPMSVAGTSLPFDCPDYQFEYRYTGIRCLAYLDGQTTIMSRAGVCLNALFPELSYLHAHIYGRCILDGELVIIGRGSKIQDLGQLENRLRLKHKLSIDVVAENYPATFTAFDILYHGGRAVTHLSLHVRRKLLEQNVRQKNRKFCIAPAFVETGRDVFAKAVYCGLDGVMAKRRESAYHMGLQSRDWHSILNWHNENLYICGYIFSRHGRLRLVAGAYDRRGDLCYRGHVDPCGSLEARTLAREITRKEHPFRGTLPYGNESAVWLCRPLACEIQHLPHQTKYLRHAQLVTFFDSFATAVK